MHHSLGPALSNVSTTASSLGYLHDAAEKLAPRTLTHGAMWVSA